MARPRDSGQLRQPGEVAESIPEACLLVQTPYPARAPVQHTLTLGTVMESWVRRKENVMIQTQEEQAITSLEELKQRYHRYLGRRASLALDEKAKAGGCVGYAPTGYKNAAGRVEVDPVLAPLVEQAFWDCSHGKSLREILATLTPKGLVSRSGKPLGVSALSAILKNPFYTGYVRYKERLYRGRHKALVSTSLFERVGRNLRRRRK